MLVLGCFSISDASVVLVVVVVVAGASKDNNETFPVDRRVCMRVFVCVCASILWIKFISLRQFVLKCIYTRVCI